MVKAGGRRLSGVAATVLAVLAVALPAGAATASFSTGSYAVTVTDGGTVYTATWDVTVTDGVITGLSYWSCCPGPRVDPLKGTVSGSEVTIHRDCSAQGQTACVDQKYVGMVSDTGSVKGTWSGDGESSGGPNTFTMTPACHTSTQESSRAPPPESETAHAAAGGCPRPTAVVLHCYALETVPSFVGPVDAVPVLRCTPVVDDKGRPPLKEPTGRVDFQFSPDGAGDVYPRATGPSGTDSCVLSGAGPADSSCASPIYLAPNRDVPQGEFKVTVKYVPASSDFRASKDTRTLTTVDTPVATRRANFKITDGAINPYSAIMRNGAALRICDDAKSGPTPSLEGLPGEVGPYDLEFNEHAHCLTTKPTASRPTLIELDSGQPMIDAWIILVP